MKTELFCSASYNNFSIQCFRVETQAYHPEIRYIIKYCNALGNEREIWKWQGYPSVPEKLDSEYVVKGFSLLLQRILYNEVSIPSGQLHSEFVESIINAIAFFTRVGPKAVFNTLTFDSNWFKIDVVVECTTDSTYHFNVRQTIEDEMVRTSLCIDSGYEVFRNLKKVYDGVWWKHPPTDRAVFERDARRIAEQLHYGIKGKTT